MNIDNMNTSNASAGLQVLKLAKRYGENAYVISGLDHDFPPATATALIGANGAGKTTFLRLVTAAAFPTMGEVLYNGVSVHSHIHQFLAKAGIVGDSSDLPQFLTAVELVESVMRSRGLFDDRKATQARARCQEIFDIVELDERREGLIGTYSSGMMQKTMLAAAIAGNPEILLLDEPFRALDVSSVSSVMQYLKGYRDNGGIILISSHQGEILDELCDRDLHFPQR